MEEDRKIIKAIFKDFINQYEKSNSFRVGMLPNGENVIYTKIKITGRQKEFMQEFIKKEIV